MVISFFDSLPPFVKTLPETKQLDYVLNQLKWMEDNSESEVEQQRLRRAAVETVLRYSMPDGPFYHDERLLQVFCIIGKLSRTMGMKSVMEELYKRKQFYEVAEFYVKWGEIFAEEKNRERFNQIWNIAVKANAKPLSRVGEAFRALLYQHFEMDDEMTVNLFKKPDPSISPSMVIGAPATAGVERKVSGGVESSSPNQPAVSSDEVPRPCHKGDLKITDQERSIEERFAEMGNFTHHPDALQRRFSRMSISKLSAISEEQSGCASGSMDPPQVAEDPVKAVLSSTDDAAKKPNLLPAECPPPLHSTLHGTSFTERFLNKAMHDFSSTVPVPPPRSVHHDAEDTTVLQETEQNETERSEYSPSPKKTKFEVYVEKDSTEPARNTPLIVYRDENTDPGAAGIGKRKSVEHTSDHEGDDSLREDNASELQSTFKKPAKISRPRHSSFFGKAVLSSPADEDEVLASAAKPDLAEKQLPDHNDEETLAGLNRKTKGGAITSTPANPFAPPIEDPIEESFRPLPSSALDDFYQKSLFDKAIGASTAFGRRMSLTEQCRARLSQKFGVENIVGGKIAGLGVDSSINDELRRLSLAPNDVDLDEPTGEGLKSVINSGINPWDEKLRERIMIDRHFCSTNLHDFPERCGLIAPGGTVVLGGERFDIEKLVGEGAFAKVYKCISEDGNTYALKFEIPPCRWEAYICETLRVRMPKNMFCSVMNIRDAYLFSNASAIVYEYHGHGSLLDMVNKLQVKRMSCSGLLTVYLAWEMSRILEAVHNAQIIHGDVKPDNFMIVHGLDENAEIDEIVGKKSFVLKLIDWGRAIDMSSLKGHTFRGKAGTAAFDCFEMQDGRPWTYQTDFFGFISTLHVVIYGKYMTTFRNHMGRYNMTSVMKRRWQQMGLLRDIFDMCMNIPDCESLPKWSTIIEGLENNIRYCVAEDRMDWKQAARELNAGIAS